MGFQRNGLAANIWRNRKFFTIKPIQPKKESVKRLNCIFWVFITTLTSILLKHIMDGLFDAISQPLVFLAYYLLVDKKRREHTVLCMYVSKEESTKIRVNIYGQGHQHSARSVIGKKPMICSSYLDMHDLWPSIISLNLKKKLEWCMILQKLVILDKHSLGKKDVGYVEMEVV